MQWAEGQVKKAEIVPQVRAGRLCSLPWGVACRGVAWLSPLSRMLHLQMEAALASEGSLAGLVIILATDCILTPIQVSSLQ